MAKFFPSMAKLLPPLEPLPRALRGVKFWVTCVIGCSLGLLEWAIGPSPRPAESLAVIVGMPVVATGLLVLAAAGYVSQNARVTIRHRALCLCRFLTRALGLKVTFGSAALLGISLSAITCWVFTHSSPALASALVAPMLATLLLMVRAGLVPVDGKIASDLGAYLPAPQVTVPRPVCRSTTVGIRLRIQSVNATHRSNRWAGVRYPKANAADAVQVPRRRPGVPTASRT